MKPLGNPPPPLPGGEFPQGGQFQQITVNSSLTVVTSPLAVSCHLSISSWHPAAWEDSCNVGNPSQNRKLPSWEGWGWVRCVWINKLLEKRSKVYKPPPFVRTRAGRSRQRKPASMMHRLAGSEGGFWGNSALNCPKTRFSPANRPQGRSANRLLGLDALLLMGLYCSPVLEPFWGKLE